MEKLYRVQMNKHGMPDFSTAEEVEPIEVHKYCWSKEFGSGESCNHEFDPNGVCKDCGFMNVRYAVEPKQGENIGTDYAECDQFICSECGIHLQGWVRIDEDDYDEGVVHEYEFRFCPHCGAKMKGADDE